MTGTATANTATAIPPAIARRVRHHVVVDVSLTLRTGRRFAACFGGRGGACGASAMRCGDGVV
jgi:hypothetical protein